MFLRGRFLKMRSRGLRTEEGLRKWLGRLILLQDVWVFLPLRVVWDLVDSKDMY